MSDRSAEQRFVVETIAGIEVDFSMDQDGDLLIQLTDSVKTQAVYLSETEARQRKWGGISRDVIYHGRDHFEYKESAAQTAWEVWAKFTETQL